MKKFLSILLFIFMAVQASAVVKPLNQVAAVVNNEVITTAQINKQLSLIKFRAKSAGKGNDLPADNVLRQQILQQLINRALQLQMAKQANLHVTSAQTNKAIQHIAKQNQVSTRALYKRMESNGFTVKSFRQEVRDEILIQMVQGQAVASRVSLSPSEVDDVLKRMQQQRVEYNIGDILITLPDTPSPAQITKAKNKALAIMAKLKQGEAFSRLAMADSSGANALKGGNLGWRKLAELPDVFATEVVSLNPGEVAGPIRAPNGFHIIKLYAVRNAKLPKGEAARRREVEQLLFQQRFQQALITWLQQLRASAYVKIYSNFGG